jgi:hypothetical protein
MYLALKISVKHQARILGIFTTSDLANQAVVSCYEVDCGSNKLVSNVLGNIFTTRDSTGGLLEEDWYIISVIPTDTIIQDLYVDFFRMNLHKVKFK